MTMSLLLEHFDDLLVTSENAEQLDRAILQLAVQGKLVEQDPNDEPAKEFLDKAFTEKNSSGTLIAHQPVQEEEKLFQLPEGWEWVRLLEICTLQTGKKDVNQGNPKGEYPFFTCANKPLWSDEYSFEGPSLILPGNGANVGMAWLFDGKFEAYQRTYVLSDFLVNEKYIHYVFMGLWESHVKGKQSGSAINYIKLGNFEKFVLPIPPLAEQKRIVARVEVLFAKTRALAKELAHSQIELDGLNKSALSYLLASETPEEFNQDWAFIVEHFDLLFQSPEHITPLRQSILELAVRGKLTRREAGDESAKELLKRIKTEKDQMGRKSSLPQISDDEAPFDLPDGWEWVRLGELVKKIGAGSTPKGGKEVYETEGTKFIRSQNVYNDGLRLDDVVYISDNINEKMSGTIVKAKDILLNITGASIARCALVPDDFDSANVNQHVMIIRLVEPEIRKFIHICMISPCIYDLIMSVQVGMSREGLSIGKLEKFVLPFPPLAEQERIVKRVEQLLSLCDALEARLQSAEEERGRLVASVMAGVVGGP